MSPNSKHGLSRRGLIAGSALDVSALAGILEALKESRERLGLTMLCITHDLRAAVTHHGRTVEPGRTAEISTHPRYKYTRALLDSIPVQHCMPVLARPA